jgi:serine/threonine protein phosphatase PrpC
VTVLRGAAATDVGRVRQVNEDRYLLAEDVFAVADGVGGHQAGEVAAQTTVDTLATELTERTTDGVVAAIQEANRAVWQLAQDRAERRGMGTTVTVLALVEEDGEEVLAIANVGDSRAYLFQRGELEQISEDHSLVEEMVREGQLTPAEAEVHPQRSIITRALGMESDLEVDVWTLIPYTGDRILLCSDGLTNEVSDDRIASTLRRLSDPQQAAADLVRQARAHGGKDNITVVVVDVVDDGGRAEQASAALGETAGAGAGGGGSARTTTSSPDTAGAGTTGAATAPGRARGGVATSDRSTLDGVGSPAGGTAPSPAPPAPAPASTAVRTPPPPDDQEVRGGRRTRPRRFTWRVLLFLILFGGIVAVVVASINWYARSTYYVGLEGNQVAIFKGRPGGFLWFTPTLVERTPLTVDDILPAARDDLQAGREQPSKADADRYVNNLRQEAAERRANNPPGVTTTTAPPTTAPPGTRS